MKTIRFFFSLAVSATMLTSCLSEPDFESVVDGEGSRLEVALFNEIKQHITTRVDDGGFCDGDAVGVYVVNYRNGTPGSLMDEGNQADNVRYTLDEANQRWIPQNPVYYKDKNTHVDIYGYYPYSTVSSVSEYSFEVLKDQSKEASNGNLATYEASDFLWAKSIDIEPTSSRIILHFNHIMAGVMVTLSEGTGFDSGEFALLEKTVLVTNTIRKAKINLSNGVVTPDGEVPSTGIIPAISSGDYRAIVVPQVVSAGTSLFSISVDNMQYAFKKSEAFTYAPGKLHKFTIEVSKKVGSGIEFKVVGESITAWESDVVSHDGTAREYLVVHCPEAGKLKETMVAAGIDYTKVKHLKLTGNITSTDYGFMKDEMSSIQSLNLKEVISYCGDNYSIPSGAFSGKSSLVRCIFPDKLSVIGDSAFTGTSLTGSLIIPEGVTRIEGYAFYDVSFQGKLELPSTVRYIGEWAFRSCDFVGNLYLPSELEYIGEMAFCYNHTFSGNLNIPPKLTTICKDAFFGCGFTGSLVIPSGTEVIYNGSFCDCKFDGELILPEGLIAVQDFAFNRNQFRYPIKFPESLIYIGDQAFCGCQFSGQLVLPNNLSHLGNNAFSDNKRMTGVLNLPESINSIPVACFNGCSNLEGIVLPKNLDTIGDYAFGGCFNVTSLQCKSTTPPHINANVFDGIGKDNLTVEVPEQSVNDYITSPGWNEFKRFSAYRDFSVSRNLFRSLNAQNSKQLLVRALSGELWSVEDKPDWISVSPSSGTGKTEIEITVSELAHGAGNREGVVTFVLDGKGYKVSIKVEQYDYEYGDNDVIINQTHRIGDGVNIVFMGDCFDAKDISEGKYLDAMNEAIGYFFDVEPYKTYRDYFNVYTVFGLSPDSGIGTVNTIRESRFGTQYTLTEGLCPDRDACFEGACYAPINNNVAQTLIVMIENSDAYAGVTYMWGDGSAIALCPMSRDIYPFDFRGIVQHEAGGHGFGKLADEYIYHNQFVTNCEYHMGDYLIKSGYYHFKELGWYENIHHEGNIKAVPWYHLIICPEYQDIVDIYEGAFLHTRGVFRSEPNSCMNNNIPYYSAISRESIVKRIMNYSGESFSFEEFNAKDIKTATASTKATDYSYPGANWYEPSNHRQPVFMGDKPSFEVTK